MAAESSRRLEGILPALVTPFEGGKVALDLLRHNISAYNAVPLGGYLVLGTTGEFPHLDASEKLAVIEAVAAEAARAPQARPVVAGTGGLSTEETVRFTGEAARAGAQAALVVPPFYYRAAMTEAALVRHYLTVAEASPVPVYLYNIPSHTGVTLPPHLLETLAEHENVAGLKDSSGDAALLLDYLRHAPEGFSILVGSASLLLPGLLGGAAGAILGVAGVAPWECAALYRAARDGRWEEAARLQRLLGPAEQMLAGRHGIAGIKWGMSLLGYFGGEPRPPLLPLDEDAKLEILRGLMDYGLVTRE